MFFLVFLFFVNQRRRQADRQMPGACQSTNKQTRAEKWRSAMNNTLRQEHTAIADDDDD